MSTHSTWSFGDIDEAAKAKKALLAAGAADESLRLDVLSDEAAPVQGNWALEYKDAAGSNDDSILDKVLTTDDLNEGQGRQEVKWRTVCALVVIHDANLDHARVQELMATFDTEERQ